MYANHVCDYYSNNEKYYKYVPNIEAGHLLSNTRRVNSMYLCNNCDKCFNNRRNFIHHTEKRLTPCKLPTHFCPSCNKGFASARALWQHRKICSGSETITSMNKIEGCGVLPMVVSRKGKENDELEHDATDYTDEEDVDNNNSEEEGGVIHNLPNTFVWNIDESTKEKKSLVFITKRYTRYNSRKIRFW